MLFLIQLVNIMLESTILTLMIIRILVLFLGLVYHLHYLVLHHYNLSTVHYLKATHHSIIVNITNHSYIEIIRTVLVYMLSNSNAHQMLDFHIVPKLSRSLLIIITISYVDEMLILYLKSLCCNLVNFCTLGKSLATLSIHGPLAYVVRITIYYKII